MLCLLLWSEIFIAGLGSSTMCLLCHCYVIRHPQGLADMGTLA